MLSWAVALFVCTFVAGWILVVGMKGPCAQSRHGLILCNGNADGLDNPAEQSSETPSCHRAKQEPPYCQKYNSSGRLM